MNKVLNGSAGTGRKILSNYEVFKCKYREVEKLSEIEYIYKFDWNFNKQNGYISIIYKNGNINENSLIDTKSNTENKFKKSLPLYKDDTLLNVFKRIMSSINIEVKDVYSCFE